MIAIRHPDNKICLWNTRIPSPKQLGSIHAEIKVVDITEYGCYFRGNGGKLVYASEIARDRHELSVWNIDDNERTATIEFDERFESFQLSSSGDRIVVWTCLCWENKNRLHDHKLMVFDTCGGTLLMCMGCADPIACVACSHDMYCVVSHLNGKITVWNVVTGQLESTMEFDANSDSIPCICPMVCSNGGDRPWSCVGCTSMRRWVPRSSLIVWDIISQEIYVEISNPYPLQHLSFGVTDSIIIGAYGHNDNDDDLYCQCTVNVWKLDRAKNHLQAVLLSHFDLHGATNLTMCFNPVINALVYVDDEDDRFIVVDVETGIEVASIEAPITYDMQFMNEGGVILL